MVNQTMDIFTLGGVPPYNHLLAGKLAVYAAASREVREAYQNRYSEAVTQIEGRILPAHLVTLTTTSAFGRSSLYNRIRYQDREVAQRLGETTGYGNVRLNAVRDIYPQIKKFLIQEGYEERMGFGKGGPKEAWRNITQVMQMLGIKGDDALHHGIRREAWAVPLAENAWEYLSGQSQQPAYYQESFDELAQYWRERWMLPRSDTQRRLAQLAAGTNSFDDHPGDRLLEPRKGRPSMQNLEVTAARFAPPRSAATRRRPQTHAHANGYQGRASHAAADQSRRTDGILLRSTVQRGNTVQVPEPRDHGFTVTNGDMTGARRLTQGSNAGWEITVTPDATHALSMAPQATTDCQSTPT